jgi:hypothetical protein
MATPVVYPIVRGSDALASGVTTAVGTGAVGIFTVNPNTLFRIVATTPVNVRFGTSAITTATAQDMYIPANVPEIFDSGSATTIAVFAVAAASVNVVLLSRT